MQYGENKMAVNENTVGIRVYWKTMEYIQSIESKEEKAIIIGANLRLPSMNFRMHTKDGIQFFFF